MQDFTLGGYGDLLGAFAALGYVTRTFHDVDADSAHLIMRHDVDYCLDYALPLAEVEAEHNVRSSYFVLMRSEFYNPSTSNAVRVMKRLSDLGHEIGLHFDASLYDQNTNVQDTACAHECTQLEDILGQAVTCVSFHRPAQALMGTGAPLGGRLHTYQSRFFTDMGYCADSQGRFRYGHPLAHENVECKRALQLVTHPVWWYAAGAQDPVARIQSFLANRAHGLSAEMAQNSLPYKKYIQNQEA